MKVVCRVGVALGFWCLALVSAGGQAALPAPDPAIVQMVAEVSKQRLSETVSTLASVPSRYTGTPGCQTAGTAIYDHLSRLGVGVEYDAFTYHTRQLPGGAGRNVVATIAGTAV